MSNYGNEADSASRSNMKELRIVTAAWVENCISQGFYSVPKADGIEAPMAVHPSAGLQSFERHHSG